MTVTDACASLLRGLALCILMAWTSGPAGAQDIGLALDKGLPDLALFALTKSESAVSPAGHSLLALQGFLHDPDGPRLQPLSRGQALVPLLRHDPNVNDGIPSDRITLGGLPFRVAEESQAKDAVLVGLQYSRWTNFSFGRAARLRFAQSWTAELEPTYGYHHLATSARVCAEQPVARWTWLDGCLTGLYDDDSVDADTSLTASLGTRKLFASGLGYHQASLFVLHAKTKDYGKDILQVGLQTLTARHGMIGADVIIAEKVEGENTLLYMAGIDWAGRIADRTLSLGLTHAATGGASIFGTPREDRITRLSVEVPVRALDLGGYAERRKSTIDAYDRTEFGITVAFRFDLLKGWAMR